VLERDTGGCPGVRVVRVPGRDGAGAEGVCIKRACFGRGTGKAVAVRKAGEDAERWAALARGFLVSLERGEVVEEGLGNVVRPG